MNKLDSYKTLLIDLALVQGLTPLEEVVLRPKPDVIIIVAHSEPFDLIFPLNGLWLDADSTMPTFKKLYRRVSKLPSLGFDFTWEEVLEYEQAMTVQSWDPADLPEPVTIPGKGGALTGPLHLKAAPYEPTEAIPKAFVDSEMLKMKNSFFTMFNNMNGRVAFNDQRIRTNYEDIQSLRSQISTALVGMSTAIQGKVYSQEESSQVWLLEHGFGAGTGIVFVTSPTGEYLWPEIIEPLPESPNTHILVTFLEPVSGLAQLLYYPQPAPALEPPLIP